MWDALNHVTGRANVRLHHCERSSALQMIATADIAVGQEVLSGLGLPKSQPFAPVNLGVLQPTTRDEGTPETAQHQGWPARALRMVRVSC